MIIWLAEWIINEIRDEDGGEVEEGEFGGIPAVYVAD